MSTARTPTSNPAGHAGPALDGLRVLDCSTVIAGPSCARYLADFGAEVVKIERPPDGDTSRRMGLLDDAAAEAAGGYSFTDRRDGQSLAWKLYNRNKRTVTLDLKSSDGREALLSLVERADVLVENFRPGKLESLGLGPDVLWARNPSLVVTRITGFGQDGPYAHRAGFATIAEAMAGWAAISGEPGGPPVLPPIALTDEICGLGAAFATMVALWGGGGQVVDANLFESLLGFMGPLVPSYFATGFLQGRMGSSIPHSIPRGVWEAADGRYVAVSTSSDAVAARVMDLIGLGTDDRFTRFAGRAAHRDEVEAALARYVAARPADEVVASFEAAQAAAAVVMDLADIALDPHVAARDVFVDVDGVRMQAPIARLSRTPGSLRWAGRALGADTDEVLSELDRDE
ncbi:MAG: CoA transferase [Acidimicrobiia bacterium]|nr:CoA transferase [Acidimicrobiia bacterium]